MSKCECKAEPFQPCLCTTKYRALLIRPGICNAVYAECDIEILNSLTEEEKCLEATKKLMEGFFVELEKEEGDESD